MREIKFRAWDIKSEVMLDNLDSVNLEEVRLGIVTESDDMLDQVKVIFMQYIGYKDKNGKEIYFDDYVKLAYSNNIYRVSQDDFGIPVFILEKANDKLNGEQEEIIDFKDFFMEFAKDNIEVLGNIYENPDLIN